MVDDRSILEIGGFCQEMLGASYLIRSVIRQSCRSHQSPRASAITAPKIKHMYLALL